MIHREINKSHRNNNSLFTIHFIIYYMFDNTIRQMNYIDYNYVSIILYICYEIDKYINIVI